MAPAAFGASVATEAWRARRQKFASLAPEQAHEAARREDYLLLTDAEIVIRAIDSDAQADHNE